MRQKAASGASHPMEIKMDLARRVISDFHSAGAARQAEEEFRRVFQQREEPREVETRTIPGETVVAKGPPNEVYVQDTFRQIKLDKLLAALGLASSVSEASRKLKEGAVYVNGKQYRDILHIIDISGNQALSLKVGRHHMNVVIEPPKG